MTGVTTTCFCVLREPSDQISTLTADRVEKKQMIARNQQGLDLVDNFFDDLLLDRLLFDDLLHLLQSKSSALFLTVPLSPTYDIECS